MKITPEMKAKFEQCKSVEEIMELAKQANLTVTNDDARKVFELLNSEDVSDEMMEKVSGGYYERPVTRRRF